MDLILTDRARCLEEHDIGVFLLHFRIFFSVKSCTFVRYLLLLYSISELASHSLHVMAHLMEAPLALKLEHGNNKKKEKRLQPLAHLFKIRLLHPSKDVHTASHVSLSSLRFSLVMAARCIPNLTGGVVPGGIRMHGNHRSPKYSQQELKRRYRHKVIETFHSTDINTPCMHDFSHFLNSPAS